MWALQNNIDYLSGCENTPCDAPKLRSRITPYIHTIEALQRQEAEYIMKTPPLMYGNTRLPMEADRMQDFNEQEGGVLRACIFPMLLKKTCNEGDIEVSEPGER